MEFDSYKDRMGTDIPDLQFRELLSQCGLRAIVVLDSFFSLDSCTDIYGDDFWDISRTGVMREIVPKVKPDLLKTIMLKGKMDYKDIVSVMEQIQPKQHPDFRFSSTERDIKGKLFLSNLCGITALKFKYTNALHWAVLFNGQVYPLIGCRNRPTRKSYVDIKEMRKDIIDFDGFGHTITYRNKDDVEILKRHTKCNAQNYCHSCVRKNWCVHNIS